MIRQNRAGGDSVMEVDDCGAFGLSATGEASAVSLINRMQSEIRALRDERDRLAADNHALNRQATLAGKLQQDLLPDRLEFDDLRISTMYHPLESVSGDIYDVARLDHEHVGLTVVDASGHGMSAGMLTALLRRSFRGARRVGDDRQILSPRDVLGRVNRQILDCNLPDCQFVTGLHAVYHRPSRSLTFARGGLCYPILIRDGQPAEQLITRGPLIGAFEQPTFEQMVVYLEPGDSVIFYSDGLEALLLDRLSDTRLDSIVQTAWYARLSERSVAKSMQDIASRLAELTPSDWPADDLTLVAMTVR